MQILGVDGHAQGASSGQGRQIVAPVEQVEAPGAQRGVRFEAQQRHGVKALVPGVVEAAQGFVVAERQRRQPAFVHRPQRPGGRHIERSGGEAVLHEPAVTILNQRNDALFVQRQMLGRVPGNERAVQTVVKAFRGVAAVPPAVAGKRVAALAKVAQPVQIGGPPVLAGHHQQRHRRRRQPGELLEDVRDPLTGLRHHIVNRDQAA